MTTSGTRIFLLLCTAFSGSVGTVAEICRGAHCFTAETADSRPCVGPHCLGRSPRQSWHFNPTNQGRSAQIAPNHHNTRVQPQQHPPPRAITDPYTIIHPQRGGGDFRRESARTRPYEVSYGCSGADCVTPQTQVSNDSRECRGIECKLPLRIRPKPKPRGCLGDSCPSGSDDASSQPIFVHMQDRAAQGLGEFPEFGYSASELGGAPLGVQLTCDIKPGVNEVPSEDALILQLQLAKGQEKFVEALKSQQDVIRDLQQRLTEQQDTLISQQREILEQQRKMYEQMDLIKVQYGMLSETVKQMSFQSLQGDIQSYFESHLQGLQDQVRSHLQKSYAVHKVDVDAKVMDVGHGLPLLDCGSCGPDEYCDFQREVPRCERCTMCPSGFFLVSQCSPTSDRTCQDRDECLEIPNLCGERVKCLNTPGGFRCLGVSEREAAANVCGHDYFFNQELEECQACSDCDGEPVVFHCTPTSDTVCGSLSDVRLSQAWAAMVALPPAEAPASHIYPGMQLNIQGKEHSTLLSSQDGVVVFQMHGLIWADHNFALKHNCRNFLQLSIRMNSSEEGRDLSGIRVEQPDGKFYQSISVSAAAEVEPNHTLLLFLKSPNHHCNQSKDLHVYDLKTPFSTLWLSHDTGAVAMTAQTSVSVHYQTTYRPTFKIMSVSDPYMVSLSHDGRGVRFTESGVVKFVFQQALYSMGHTCIGEGYSVSSYLNRNASNMELMQVYKSGVNYRDTSISLSGAANVEAGDTLSFEIQSPVQCNVRYFGDGSGISTLSLLWIPSAISCSLSATISKSGLPSGAVRNKALSFRLVSSSVPQIQLVATGQFARKNFVFRESGVANVAFNLKLIHSCNVVKLTLHRQEGDQAQSTPVAQQVGGHMPEGAEWTSVGLRASLEVHNGTMVFITLDCVRGRINQITHEGGTNISILWVAS